MREDLADLWTTPADARCLTTNGDTRADGAAIMGRGVALQAKSRYVGLHFRLGEQLRLAGNVTQIIWTPPGESPLVAFPVKYHYKDWADLDLIVKSAQQLVTLADAQGWKSIVLPRPGCGSGRRHWQEVRSRLWMLLDDRFLVVTL